MMGELVDKSIEKIQYNLSIEEIYEYYKNEIDIYKLYYKDKLYQKYIAISIYVVGWLFLWISGIIMTYPRFKHWSLVFVGLFLVSMILSIGMVFRIYKDIKNRILKDIQKEDERTSEYHKKYEAQNLFRFIMNKRFVEFIERIKITDIQQKKELSKLLYEKHKNTKVSKLWSVGVLAALCLPIWSTIVEEILKKAPESQTLFYDGMFKISILIVIIIGVIKLLHYTIYSIMSDFINSKSRRYYEMYEAVQTNIIYSENKKSYVGELTLRV
jgi:ABC-type multidrug transport system fused ATPase/permease subunit